MSISLSRESMMPFKETLVSLREAILREEMGVVCEMDVHETFQRKNVGVFEPYVILGICHPPSAYQVLSGDKALGVLLPCNILVYEESGRVIVTAVDPHALLLVTGREELNTVAQEISEKLHRIMSSIVE